MSQDETHIYMYNKVQVLYRLVCRVWQNNKFNYPQKKNKQKKQKQKIISEFKKMNNEDK